MIPRSRSFKVSISVHDRTGKIQAVYWTLRTPVVEKTLEALDSTVLVDLNSNGEVVGVELLGTIPCRIDLLAAVAGVSGKTLADDEKLFLIDTIPVGMLSEETATNKE